MLKYLHFHACNGAAPLTPPTSFTHLLKPSTRICLRIKSFFRFFFRRRRADNASKCDMWGYCDLPRKRYCLFMNISGFRILAPKKHNRNLQSMARRANGNLTRKLEKAARVQVIDYRRQPLVMFSIISPRIRSKLKSTGSERENRSFFVFGIVCSPPELYSLQSFGQM